MTFHPIYHHETFCRVKCVDIYPGDKLIEAPGQFNEDTQKEAVVTSQRLKVLQTRQVSQEETQVREVKVQKTFNEKRP